MRHRAIFSAGFVLSALSAGACSSSDGGAKTNGQFAQSVTQAMHDKLQGDLDDMIKAAQDLQAAAPTHAWDASDPAVPMMQDAWIRARHAYEHVEGATAPIFPDIDVSIDGRVEDFGDAGSGTLKAGCDMFAGTCMTGFHAVERILYSNVTPQSVKDYEAGLGYAPVAGFPSTDAEADEFKNKLCAKIVKDATDLKAGWQPAMIDVGTAFQGLISLMNEQKEKVTKAGLHEEESRYSQRTMDDLRQNLQGTSNIYAIFQDWIKSRSGGDGFDAKIESGFKTLSTLYDSAQYMGAAFPEPPATWSDQDPSDADKATPFGQLYEAVDAAVDPTGPDSVVTQMNKAAAACGLPQFTDG